MIDIYLLCFNEEKILQFAIDHYKKYFPNGTYAILKRDKELRVDNQYYLKNKPVNINIRELSDFILIIRNKVNSITLSEINKVRDEIKKIIAP